MIKYAMLMIVLLVCPGISRGDLIASFALGEGGKGGVGVYDNVGFVLYGATEFPYDPVYPLFTDMSFYTSDDGQSFSILSDADDPDFSSLVAFFTDGVDQFIVFGDSLPSGPLSPGSQYIQSESSTFSTPGTDLQGTYSITEFELVINSLNIDSPGSDSNGDGDWTDAEYNYTFKFLEQPYRSPRPARSSCLDFSVCRGRGGHTLFSHSAIRVGPR